MMSLLNYNRADLIRYVRRKFGKSEIYGDTLFRSLYKGVCRDRSFENSPSYFHFLDCIEREPLPRITGKAESEGTVKFLLDMGRGFSSESVLIPMKGYSTLCLSSQLGCRFGCVFCATGAMGFVKNLTTAEIVSQVMTARFTMGVRNLQNIVFMGMGEPFDNFENMITALDILSDGRGLNIPKRRISISTAGHVEGIERLTELCSLRPEDHFHTLHLSVSLHSAVEATRSSLMPVNKRFPLTVLKESLINSPFSKIKDGLYIEYMIIPGVTDTGRELDSLLRFLEGMKVKINLIPYNPVSGTAWRAPREEETASVWQFLKERGYYCRTRISKGEKLMAACGQLGSRSSDNECTG